MEYDFRPVGCYEYDEEISIETAKELLRKAKEQKEPIVCKVKKHDQESGEMELDFHGIKGIIKRGYISKRIGWAIQYLLGKTTKVFVEKIREDQFEANRVETEEMAEKQLFQLQRGDLVEGVVKQFHRERECAFVDVAEDICAYIGIKDITNLPVTCCGIEDFLKVGQKISGYIIYLPGENSCGRYKNIHISTINRENSGKKELKNFFPGMKYEGLAVNDRMYKDVYYIVVNREVYIKFTSQDPILADQKVTVEIQKINEEDGWILGCLPNERGQKEDTEKSGQGVSMFQTAVKAVISPFAMREKEEKIFETETANAVPLSGVQRKYRDGQLTEQHVQILKIISRLVVCTTKQILSYAYSHEDDSDIGGQYKITTKVNSLMRQTLIDVNRFESESGKGIFRVYSLTENGYLFLKNYCGDREAKYMSYIRMASTGKIKKILAANQIALACMEKSKHCKKYVCQDVLYFSDKGKLRPTSILEFEKSILLLEAVRREEGMEEDFLAKSERYETFISEYKMGNISRKNLEYIRKAKPLYLILVCEDQEHAEQVREQIKDKNLEKSILYTYELMMFQKNMEFSVFKINDAKEKTYFSLLDLAEENKACYTTKEILGYDISDHDFNSFPEQWLKYCLEDGKNFQIENVRSEDENQNMEFLHKGEYSNFLKTAQLSREKASETIWEPRIFIFGNGGAGKTSLIKMLANYPFDANEPKTNGVQVMPDIWRRLPWMECEDKKIDRISVWDFAGQECDNILSSFLITEAALCIVVVDSRREDHPDDWIEYIQTYAPRARILLVMNKIDEDHKVVHEENGRWYNKIDVISYLKRYSNIVGVYYVSCKKPNMEGSETNKLKHDICRQILEMENQFKSVWAIGIQKLSDELREHEEGFLTKLEFKKMHRKLGLSDYVDAEETLRLCVSAGICIYHKRMEEYIVLKPQWLTCALAKILQSQKYTKYKWQLTREEILEMIEEPQEGGPYCYEEGEGETVLALMEKLKICVRVGEEYIFPCFLSYPMDLEANDIFSELDDWYEQEICYKSLPLDIFPELQARLWNLQWNKQKEPKIAYEPDKSKIVFVQNGHKMLAWKRQNSIVLAVERMDKRSEKLSETEKQAMREARMVLKLANNTRGLELEEDENSKAAIKEKIVLKGRSKDTNMKKIRYPYAKENLRKISMAGVKTYYFPEIDRWHNVSWLLMNEYTKERKLEIFRSYAVKLETASNEENMEEELRFLGSGFWIPYNGQWYVICCNHEIEKAQGTILAETSEGSKVALELKCVDEEEDLALLQCSARTDLESRLIPKELFSFSYVPGDDTDLVCIGNTESERFKKMENLCRKSEQDQKGHVVLKGAQEDSGRFYSGFSGAPVLNVEKGSVIGMLLSQQRTKEELAFLMVSMESIWKFIESL